MHKQRNDLETCIIDISPVSFATLNNENNRPIYDLNLIKNSIRK